MPSVWAERRAEENLSVPGGSQRAQKIFMEFEERRSRFSERRVSQNLVDLYLKLYDCFHVKTTLDIPSGLLSEAMRFAGAKTKRAAVLAALNDFSRRGRMREMAMRLGNSETFMTAVDLESLRLQEKPE